MQNLVVAASPCGGLPATSTPPVVTASLCGGLPATPTPPVVAASPCGGLPATPIPAVVAASPCGGLPATPIPAVVAASPCGGGRHGHTPSTSLAVARAFRCPKGILMPRFPPCGRLGTKRPQGFPTLVSHTLHPSPHRYLPAKWTWKTPGVSSNNFSPVSCLPSPVDCGHRPRSIVNLQFSTFNFQPAAIVPRKSKIQKNKPKSNPHPLHFGHRPVSSLPSPVHPPRSILNLPSFQRSHVPTCKRSNVYSSNLQFST
jgi:hypothetical protein